MDQNKDKTNQDTAQESYQDCGRQDCDSVQKLPESERPRQDGPGGN